MKGHLLYFPCKREGPLIGVRSRRVGIQAHIQGFVRGEAQRHGGLNPAFRGQLVVGEEIGRAAFAQPAVVIGELVPQGGLAGGQLFLGRQGGVFGPK